MRQADRLAASGRPRPCRTAPRRAVLAGAATRRDWPASGSWRPSWPGVVVPSSCCSCSSPPWPGWSFARSPGPPSLGEPGELVGLRSRNIPVIPTAGLAGLAGFIPLIQMLSDRFGFVPKPTGIDLNMSQWSVPGELSETGRSCDSLGMNAHVIPPRPGRWVTSDLKAGWYDQLPGPALGGPPGTWPSELRAAHSRT